MMSPIYRFWWDEGEELVEINETNPDMIELMLDEYREVIEPDAYNVPVFLNMLAEAGYTVQICEPPVPDFVFYF